MTFSDESTKNQSRMTREVAGLKRKLTDMRQEADKCQGYRDDLEECKVEDTLLIKMNFLTQKLIQSGKDLLLRELQGQEEIIHKLKHEENHHGEKKEEPHREEGVGQHHEERREEHHHEERKEEHHEERREGEEWREEM